MTNITTKLIVNPKLVTFLNNMSSNCSPDLIANINGLVKAVDVVNTRYKQDLEPPIGEELVIYVDKPKRTLTMKTDAQGAKLQLTKMNDIFRSKYHSNISDPNYRYLINIANTGHDKSVPLNTRFTKFMIRKYEINVKVGLADPSKCNHLIKGMSENFGKVQHYTFTFSSKSLTSKVPIDFSLMRH